MKVLGINGSARRDGNTAILINYVFEELKKEGIKTELIQMGGNEIHGCRACYKCLKNKNKRCAVTTDMLNEYLEKMLSVDGIILGSPTYFADITSGMKSLIDRAGLVSRFNGDMFKHKAGAAVVSVRRGGAINAFDSITHFFLISQMIVPGSIYWNIGIGRNIGDVEKDEEGINTMKILGQNIAWLLKRLQ